MATEQIKRLAMPNTWPLPRKGTKWVAKPNPGAHKIRHALAVVVAIRDILKLTSNAREAKRLFATGAVLVNSKKVRDVRDQVGLFDTVSVPKLNKYYRFVLARNGKLALAEIMKAEAEVVPAKVIGRSIANGGNAQLNLSNGWNYFNGKEANTGDTVLFANGKPSKIIALKPGCLVTVIEGKHVGILARLKAFRESGDLKKKKLAVLQSDSAEFETNMNYLFAVGEKEAEFKAVK